MKKILSLVLFTLLSQFALAQPSISYRSNNQITVYDYNLFTGSSFRVPVFNDTTNANAAYTLDSCGKIIFLYKTNSLWYRACSPRRWVPVGTGTSGNYIDSLKRSSDSIYARKNGVFIFQYIDSTGGGGSVSISQGYGIITTPNPITNTGTVKVDTATLSNKYLRVNDTLNMLLPYLRKVDTTSMLLPYLRKIDTTAMLLPYLRKVDTTAMLLPYLRKVDTAAMLLPYLRKVDTTSMLLPYLRKIDTTAMLLPYLRKIDTTAMLLPYLRKVDTTSMLLPYLRKVDTTAMLNPYLRKVDTTGQFITNIFRTPGKDSIYFKKGATTFAIKDSIANVSGYVPYTGATQDLDMGANGVTAKFYKVTGTAGNGHIDFKHQSADASSQANSTLLYANSDGYLKWKNDNLYYSTLAMPQTADRIYTYQNKTYTLGDSADIAARVKYTDTATMLAPYLRTNVAAATYLAKSDTASMLAPYAKSINVVKYTDTASMLSPYLRSNTAAATYLAKSDSSTYYTKYRSDTSRTNIYAAINGKAALNPTANFIPYNNGTSFQNSFLSNNTTNYKLQSIYLGNANGLDMDLDDYTYKFGKPLAINANEYGFINIGNNSGTTTFRNEFFSLSNNKIFYQDYEPGPNAFETTVAEIGPNANQTYQQIDVGSYNLIVNQGVSTQQEMTSSDITFRIKDSFSTKSTLYLSQDSFSLNNPKQIILRAKDSTKVTSPVTKIGTQIDLLIDDPNGQMQTRFNNSSKGLYFDFNSNVYQLGGSDKEIIARSYDQSILFKSKYNGLVWQNLNNSAMTSAPDSTNISLTSATNYDFSGSTAYIYTPGFYLIDAAAIASGNLVLPPATAFPGQQIIITNTSNSASINMNEFSSGNYVYTTIGGSGVYTYPTLGTVLNIILVSNGIYWYAVSIQ